MALLEEFEEGADVIDGAEFHFGNFGRESRSWNHDDVGVELHFESRRHFFFRCEFFVYDFLKKTHFTVRKNHERNAYF